jgi:hypothetical protein
MADAPYGWIRYVNLHMHYATTSLSSSCFWSQNIAAMTQYKGFKGRKKRKNNGLYLISGIATEGKWKRDNGREGRITKRHRVFLGKCKPEAPCVVKRSGLVMRASGKGKQPQGIIITEVERLE